MAGEIAADHQNGGIVPAAARARKREQPAATARQRSGSVQHAAQVSRPDVLVDAVAAKDQHLATAQGHTFDVRHGHGAIAHHACRIVVRAAGRWCLAQVSIGIVDRQGFRGLVPPGAHAIDTAVADPGDEPFRQQHASPRAQRHGRRARGPRATGDASADLTIGAEQRITDRRRIDTAPVECHVQA